MTCYHPIDAWRSATEFTANGSRKIVFRSDQGLPWTHFKIPCGQCIGCRLARSLDSAVRAVHENQFHEHSIFATFTYAPEFLPIDGGFQVRDLQLFWKRLRKYLGETRIRYFACAEYGSQRARPHFHAIIYGWMPNDKKLHHRNFHGNDVYTSETLQKLWPLGWANFGNVTIDSCAYVARYITKKQLGDGSREYVTEDGSIIPKERTFWSQKPAIGRAYIEKNWEDVFLRGDCCMLLKNGKMCKFPVPVYYDRWLAENHPDVFADIKDERAKKGIKLESSPDNSSLRLRVREECQEIRAKKLARNYELYGD